MVGRLLFLFVFFSPRGDIERRCYSDEWFPCGHQLLAIQLSFLVVVYTDKRNSLVHNSLAIISVWLIVVVRRR